MPYPVHPMQINVSELQTFGIVAEKYNPRAFVTDLHATHLFEINK